MMRVLLVEDNPDDVELTLRAFERHRMVNEIIVARDGEEALAHLSGDAPLPALVLLDLKLPRVDGFEVLRRIRGDARTRLLPVVVLTTSAQERDLLQGYSLGANSYIIKPVDFEQFIECARQIGVYWLMLNQLPPVTNGDHV